MTEDDAPQAEPGPRVSRRAFLGAAGTAGLAGAVAGGIAIGQARESDVEALRPERLAFYGSHQAGVATPVQNRLFFASFDVTAEHLADVRELMRIWTPALARMCAGHSVGLQQADEVLSSIVRGFATQGEA